MLAYEGVVVNAALLKRKLLMVGRCYRLRRLASRREILNRWCAFTSAKQPGNGNRQRPNSPITAILLASSSPSANDPMTIPHGGKGIAKLVTTLGASSCR